MLTPHAPSPTPRVSSRTRSRRAGRPDGIHRASRRDGALGAAGTVVGSSSFGDVDTVREHVHLGWTMFGSRWWGTAVNPECKLLLLEHAFDTCGFGRVKIQTDVVNARSRAAILKLGRCPKESPGETCES